MNQLKLHQTWWKRKQNGMSWDGQYLQIGIIIVPSTSIIEPRVKVKKKSISYHGLSYPTPSYAQHSTYFSKNKIPAEEHIMLS